jgi:hypothetical protein
MSSYTIITRVVLHKDDARKQPHLQDAKEYETLHAEMHKRDYRRFYVADGDKEKLKLPPGEYAIDLDADDGNAARKKAMAKAKAAATIATSAERFSLLVTGGRGIRSYRLEVITKDPDA